MPPDPAAYGPRVAPLLTDRLMPLGPGTPDLAMKPRLAALDPATMFGAPTRDLVAAKAALAGLWLLHDFWEQSHAIAQELNTPEGSYWHAIQHRREGDASNSKYWLRRVGEHPIHLALAQEAADLGVQGQGWDDWYAETFTDLCVRPTPGTETTLMRLQRAEWDLLFDWCAGMARGN